MFIKVHWDLLRSSHTNNWRKVLTEADLRQNLYLTRVVCCGVYLSATTKFNIKIKAVCALLLSLSSYQNVRLNILLLIRE